MKETSSKANVKRYPKKKPVVKTTTTTTRVRRKMDPNKPASEATLRRINETGPRSLAKAAKARYQKSVKEVVKKTAKPQQVKPIPKPKPTLRRTGKSIRITGGSKFAKRTAATQAKEATKKATSKAIKRQADAKLKRDAVSKGHKEYKQKGVRTAHQDMLRVGKKHEPKDFTKAEKAAVRKGGTEGARIMARKTAEAAGQSIKATKELERTAAKRYLARTRKGGPVGGATKAQKAAAKKKQDRYQKAAKKKKK